MESASGVTGSQGAVAQPLRAEREPQAEPAVCSQVKELKKTVKVLVRRKEGKCADLI